MNQKEVENRILPFLHIYILKNTRPDFQKRFFMTKIKRRFAFNRIVVAFVSMNTIPVIIGGTKRKID